MTELESIVAAMEAPDLPLEQSLAHFERGTRLLRFCEGALGEADDRRRIPNARARRLGPGVAAGQGAVPPGSQLDFWRRLLTSCEHDAVHVSIYKGPGRISVYNVHQPAQHHCHGIHSWPWHHVCAAALQAALPLSGGASLLADTAAKQRVEEFLNGWGRGDAGIAACQAWRQQTGA